MAEAIHLLMGEAKEMITRLESVDAEQILSAVLHGQSKLALHIRSLLRHTTSNTSSVEELMKEVMELITQLADADAEQIFSAVQNGHSQLALHIRNLFCHTESSRTLTADAQRSDDIGIDTIIGAGIDEQKRETICIPLGNNAVQNAKVSIVKIQALVRSKLEGTPGGVFVEVGKGCREGGVHVRVEKYVGLEAAVTAEKDSGNELHLNMEEVEKQPDEMEQEKQKERVDGSPYSPILWEEGREEGQERKKEKRENKGATGGGVNTAHDSKRETERDEHTGDWVMEGLLEKWQQFDDKVQLLERIILEGQCCQLENTKAEKNEKEKKWEDKEEEAFAALERRTDKLKRMRTHVLRALAHQATVTSATHCSTLQHNCNNDATTLRTTSKTCIRALQSPSTPPIPLVPTPPAPLTAVHPACARASSPSPRQRAAQLSYVRRDGLVCASPLRAVHPACARVSSRSPRQLAAQLSYVRQDGSMCVCVSPQDERWNGRESKGIPPLSVCVSPLKPTTRFSHYTLAATMAIMGAYTHTRTHRHTHSHTHTHTKTIGRGWGGEGRGGERGKDEFTRNSRVP